MPFRIPRKKVEFDGGDVEVRAISLQDVAIIVESHQYAVDRVITMVRSRVEYVLSSTGESVAKFDFSDPELFIDTMMEVIRESPLVVTNIISLCSDDEQDEIHKLPLPVTTEILQAIGDLTFKDAAAVKKFVADVMRLIRGILPPTMDAAA